MTHIINFRKRQTRFFLNRSAFSRSISEYLKDINYYLPHGLKKRILAILISEEAFEWSADLYVSGWY